MNELQDYTQKLARKLYSDILDYSGGDSAKFQELAAQAAKQIAKETYRLLPYEVAEEAFDVFSSRKKFSPAEQSNAMVIYEGETNQI